MFKKKFKVELKLIFKEKLTKNLFAIFLIFFFNLGKPVSTAKCIIVSFTQTPPDEVFEMIKSRSSVFLVKIYKAKGLSLKIIKIFC